MDINNPALNLNLDDNTKIDESLKQEGTTINLGAGATYNQNSSNTKSPRTSSGALFKVLFVSIVCDVLLGWFLWTTQSEAMDAAETRAEEVHVQMMSKWERSRKEADDEFKRMMEQAREGNIWLIRYDIIRTIDLYEVRRHITTKEYTRLKDEFQYYRETLKGNHGLQERWDEFTAKLLSGEVKMDAPLTSI